ncbi:MAG: hypothetical protein R3Y47_09140 [Lachnospiraceae bacterium]
MNDGTIICLFFSIIIIVPTVVVFTIFNLNKARKKKCTQEVTGIITKYKNIEGTGHLTATYQVLGSEYKRTEQLKYTRIKLYKIAGIPIGRKRRRTLEDITLGHPIQILYNPSKPKSSYFKDNKTISRIKN